MSASYPLARSSRSLPALSPSARRAVGVLRLEHLLLGGDRLLVQPLSPARSCAVPRRPPLPPVHGSLTAGGYRASTSTAFEVLQCAFLCCPWWLLFVSAVARVQAPEEQGSSPDLTGLRPHEVPQEILGLWSELGLTDEQAAALNGLHLSIRDERHQYSHSGQKPHNTVHQAMVTRE
jgi:hypothetical protein